MNTKPRATDFLERVPPALRPQFAEIVERGWGELAVRNGRAVLLLANPDTGRVRTIEATKEGLRIDHQGPRT